jgi:predicted aspartyl protease
MMNGIVDRNCEATIRLVVSNESKQTQVIDAVIDTGFTGFLTLPMTAIDSLNLRLYSREEGTLGDGSTCIFDVYSIIFRTHDLFHSDRNNQNYHF